MSGNSYDRDDVRVKGVDPSDKDGEGDNITRSVDGTRNRLDVSTEMDALGPAATPGCPVMSNNITVEFQDPGTSLTASYQTIESYTGSGKLFGFNAKFTSNAVDVKLTIDSNVVFELIDIADYTDVLGSGPHPQTNVSMSFDNTLKILYFAPYCSIAFDTEWKLEARKTGGSPVTYSKGIYTQTKET